MLNFLINAQDYLPPLGIPAPEFGINEQWSDYYTRPEPWNQEVAGWYYIDQSCGTLDPMNTLN